MIPSNGGKTFHVFNMWDEDVSLAWEDIAAPDGDALLTPDNARALAALLIAAADEINSSERDVD